MRTGAYLAVAVVMVVFGVVGLITIGAPFLLTGLLMLALWKRRSRSEVMVPALLWPWVFTFVYVLLAPLGCTSKWLPTTGEAVGPSFTRCSNVLGIDYSGQGSYSPPLAPALVVATAVATVAALGTRSFLTRRAASPSGASPGAP